MEDSLVSIIMPTYNCAEYLERSINSVLNQSYKNLELIIVDDGSTDSTLESLYKFSKKDARIKVFHKTNGGVSSARNYGLDKASGDFVMFIDADDEYCLDAVESLVINQKKYNADLVCGRVIVVKNNVRQNYYEVEFADLVGSPKDPEFINSCYVNFVMTACYSKLYKKSVVENVRQLEDISYGEDTVFFINCLANVDTMVVLSQFIYIYYIVQREDCLTITANKDWFNNCIKTLNYLYRDIQKIYPNFPLLWGKSCVIILRGMFNYVKRIIKANGNNKTIVMKKIEEFVNNELIQEVVKNVFPENSIDIFLKKIIVDKDVSTFYNEMLKEIKDEFV